MEYYAQGQGAPSSYPGLEGAVVSDLSTGPVLTSLPSTEDWSHRHDARSPASTGADTPREEAVWQMTLQPPEAMDPPQGQQYPERPGEPDCTYYMRTGLCGFGMSCRFNHPPNRKLAAAVARNKGEYPERHGQPECQYYLKTGTCKFGSTCKYHHPREKAGSTGRVQLNVLGLPLRQGEKECAYYMRTGSCKYNITCKFHHPPPTTGSVLVPISTGPIYATAGGPSMPAPQYPGGLPSWPVARAPYLPSPRIQGPSSYGPPMLLPAQGIVSMPGWSTYQGPVGAVASPEGQQHPMGTGYVYTAQQTDPVVGSVHGSYPSYLPGSSGMGLPALQPQQSLGGSHNNKEMIFPERPGQPECQYYMKTGDCKFGITCKYHHPKDRATPSPTCGLSPMGLPLRQGAQPCTFYARYGICKFGPTCKFDHPVPGTGLPYSPSASSLTDMPVAPYPLGSAGSNLAPSSSSDAPFDPMSTPSGASTSNPPELPTNVNNTSSLSEGPSLSIHTQTREGSISSSEAAAQTNDVTPTTTPQQQQQQQQAGQGLSLQGLSLGSGGGNTKQQQQQQQQQQQAVDILGST